MQIPPSGASAFGWERSVQEMELNILMYLAVILVAGLLFGRLAKFVKLPNVTGYLVAGLVIGPCVLKILPETIVSDFSLISEMALAFIAFTVGLTFKRSYFKRVGFTPVVIAIFEAMVAVFLVQGALVAFGFDVEFALVLGATMLILTALAHQSIRSHRWSDEQAEKEAARAAAATEAVA